MRVTKPPTRRQLAEATIKTVQVINGQSANQDALKAQIDRLEARQRAFDAMTRSERFAWIWKGTRGKTA